MLTIRLTRKGKKNQPFFKVVVIDKRRSAKGGRAVEELGYVNPLTKKHSLKKERVLYWIKSGAQPSPRVHNLLVSEKIIDAKKINLYKKSKKAVETAAAPIAPGAEAPKEAKAAEEAKEAPAPKVVEKPEEKPAEAPKEEAKKEPEAPAKPEK